MSKPVRIIPGSWGDNAILSATSQAGSLVVSNLQNYLPRVVWRSTNTADQTINVPFERAEAVSGFVLWNHNLTYLATVTLQASNDAGFSSLTLDKTWPGLEPVLGLGEGALGQNGLGGYTSEGWKSPFLVQWFDVVVARYWRVIIKDSNNPAGYIQAGRLMLQQYWEPEFNMSWGSEEDIVDPSQITRTRGGSWRSNELDNWRVVRVNFEWLRVFSSDSLMALKAARGRAKDVLISLYPETGTVHERRNTVLGVMTEWSPNTTLGEQRFGAALTIEESI